MQNLNQKLDKLTTDLADTSSKLKDTNIRLDKLEGSVNLKYNSSEDCLDDSFHSYSLDELSYQITLLSDDLKLIVNTVQNIEKEIKDIKNKLI